jgi:magnesium chelatase family protein
MTTSLPGPGVACVHGAVLTGIHAEIIEVQATVAVGAPGFAIIGVPRGGNREMRDRVRAAVLNSGLAWPSGDITVSLGSVGLFHCGCGLDLPMAVAILTAAGTVPAGPATGRVFAAELGLDGRLRPVRGIVPVLMAAAAGGGHVTAVIARRTPQKPRRCPAPPSFPVSRWVRWLPGFAASI